MKPHHAFLWAAVALLLVEAWSTALTSWSLEVHEALQKSSLLFFVIGVILLIVGGGADD